MNQAQPNKNREMLETGSFPRLLLNLCLPAVVIMLVMIVYNMTDTFSSGSPATRYRSPPFPCAALSFPSSPVLAPCSATADAPLSPWLSEKKKREKSRN